MVGLSHAVSESSQAEVCLSTLGATWYILVGILKPAG